MELLDCGHQRGRGIVIVLPDDRRLCVSCAIEREPEIIEAARLGWPRVESGR